MTDPISTTKSPLYLTTEEVAERFRTTADTVRFWKHIGTGPKSFKVGRRRLYAVEDVEAYAAAARAAADDGGDAA